MATVKQAIAHGLSDSAWRTNLAAYAHAVSGGKWQAWPYLKQIAQVVQATIRKGNGRIIVNAPPRHGKSELISKWLPVWYFDLFPEGRVILTSYGDSLASEWGRAVRDEIATNDQVWVKPRVDATSATSWITSSGGSMRTAGVGGPITGKGGDLLIVDDPHKNWEEALSATMRRKVVDWFNSTLYSRAEPGATIVVMQTRWHEHDLSGYLLDKHEDDWKLLRLPAIAETDDITGRREGEALCPDRYTADRLNAIKRAMGSLMFAGLYQQRPAPIEGGLVKREWFKRWQQLPQGFDEQIQAWDLTFSKTGSSYVVGQVWGRSGSSFYLVHQIRERMSFLEMLRAIVTMSEQWPEATDKLVEKAANGHAVIDTLSEKIPGILPVIPESSKEARLAAVSGFIEAGNVWVPDSTVAEWADDFVEEVAGFPNAANDDQVDTMTMALNRLGRDTYNYDIIIPDSGVRSNPWSFADARPT
jgi:predicted phage terminase large subunit-like protein